MLSTGVGVAEDGAADLVKVHDTGVMPGLGKLVDPGKVVHLTVTEEGVLAKVEVRNFI